MNGRAALSMRVFILAASALVVECTSANAASSRKSTEIDACSLLSTEELSRILGSPVRRPRPGTAQEGTTCRFGVGGTDTLNISLWPTTQNNFAEFKKTLAEGGAKLEDLSGTGDAGFYWENRIYVLAGTQDRKSVV